MVLGVNPLYLGGLHISLYILFYFIDTFHLEASEPKWVNLVLNIIGVNSLRLEGLHLTPIWFQFVIFGGEHWIPFLIIDKLYIRPLKIHSQYRCVVFNTKYVLSEPYESNWLSLLIHRVCDTKNINFYLLWQTRFAILSIYSNLVCLLAWLLVNVHKMNF